MIPRQVIKLAHPNEVRATQYPGYFVTDDGRVISIKRSGTTRLSADFAHVLKTNVRAAGYPVADISTGGSRKPESIHRLVLEAFVGPCPDGMVCCHNDGNPLNSRLSNLRWDTQSANVLEGSLNRARGEQSGSSKLTTKQVRAIRTLLSQGLSYQEIGETYGVTGGAIRAIDKGLSWAWLE